MKKIGILTWLYNENYGSILQAYALQRFIVLLGYEVENIDYNPGIKTKLLNFLINKNSPTLILEKLVSFRTKKACDNPFDLKYRNNRFELFKENNMHLSSKYKNPSEIKDVNGKYDTYICGSDQIWSPVLMNPIYYFAFLDDSYKKIAYAPSFGVTDIPKIKGEKIKKFLLKFDYISVREQQGTEVVKNLIGKEVPSVVDPTLLLSVDEWNAIASNRLVSENYILCYFLTFNQAYFDKIEKISESTGYKVVLISIVKKTYNTDFMTVTDAGPNEWISLIKYAKLVCTDSFHGTIFSLIYKRDFYVFRRFQDASKKSQNSRIYNLLRMAGLQDRLIQENTEINKETMHIKGYNGIQSAIEKEKKKSIDWLMESLSSEGKNNE